MEGTVRATVRLGTPSDAPTIARLIKELAAFEELSHACFVSEEKLLASLWKLPPFQGPTVFILEVTNTNPTPNPTPNPEETSIVRDVVLKKPIQDPEIETYTSGNSTIVGFVLFFPNFSTFLAQGGFYIEDLYVRKPYRGGGFGTLLLKSVVQQAKARGAGRVEWCVLDWNVNAIKFYEAMGAVVMPEWRICRLTGEALQACAL